MNQDQSVFNPAVKKLIDMGGPTSRFNLSGEAKREIESSVRALFDASLNRSKRNKIQMQQDYYSFAKHWGVEEVYARAIAFNESLEGDQGIKRFDVSEALKQLDFAINETMFVHSANMVFTKQTISKVNPNILENVQVNCDMRIEDPDELNTYIQLLGSVNISVDLDARMINVESANFSEIYLVTENKNNSDEVLNEIEDVFFRCNDVVDLKIAQCNFEDQVIKLFTNHPEWLGVFEEN